MTSSDDLEDSAAPLIEHLAELRTRLIRSVIALLIGIVLAFAVAEPILQFLLAQSKDPNRSALYTSPQEYLFTLFRISFVFGFGLAFPVIAHQLWRFVAPGLYRSEKAAFLPFILASPLMFLLGASFAHFVVTPLAMAFFLGFADVSSIFANLLAGTVDQLPPDAAIVPETDDGIRITFFGKVNESLDITLKFIMAFGLCFQLPVLLTLMGKAGLRSEIRRRRHSGSRRSGDTAGCRDAGHSLHRGLWPLRDFHPACETCRKETSEEAARRGCAGRAR